MRKVNNHLEIPLFSFLKIKMDELPILDKIKMFFGGFLPLYNIKGDILYFRWVKSGLFLKYKGEVTKVESPITDYTFEKALTRLI